MTESSPLRPPLRVHLTNVAGAGATQLLLSLLPALERNEAVKIAAIYLPDRGRLASYMKAPDSGAVHRYRRWLPNALSRVLECVVFGRRFDGGTPLLVLGDLPLRCRAPQTVFVQTPHLGVPERFRWTLDHVKFAIARQIFRLNASRVHAFIVQTSVMRDVLAASYPSIANRIHVVAQPVPVWLLESSVRRAAGFVVPKARLRLIYPAAEYPHKNHRLLDGIKAEEADSWPVEKLTLTVSAARDSAARVSWIECVGHLSSAEMVKAYCEVDALLFLSTDESYGFPLIEAMFVGLPIVCPDLPYARALCADGAIYFDPHSLESLRQAIVTLHERLSTGWWPDWTAQVATIPPNWDVVAGALIEIACGQVASYPGQQS